jgi:hypothetical protein
MRNYWALKNQKDKTEAAFFGLKAAGYGDWIEDRHEGGKGRPVRKNSSFTPHLHRHKYKNSLWKLGIASVSRAQLEFARMGAFWATRKSTSEAWRTSQAPKSWHYDAAGNRAHLKRLSPGIGSGRQPRLSRIRARNAQS